jgi:hypothetical protein
MFDRRLVAGFSMLAMLCGVTPAMPAKINVSFTMVHDRLRPDPLKAISATVRYEVNLGQSGAIKEDRARNAGTFSDAEQKKARLGDGQWQVAGENQLRRTINAAQSTTVMTITTSGNSCKLDVKFMLKAGFNEFKYKRIDDGTMAFYGQPSSVSTTCTIKD